MATQQNYHTKTLVSTGTPLFDADEITVIYDGVEYHWSKYFSMISPATYGAEVYNQNTINFTLDKPIAIGAGLGGAIYLNYPSNSAPLTHTIEIYAMNEIDKQPVWKKIGGSDSPTGELLFEATLDNWLENEGVYSTSENVDRFFPNDITVEWDGDLYQCTYNEEFNAWGATPTEQGIDWSTYPFIFSVDEGSMEITIGSPTDGTHTIKVYG